MVFKYFFVCLQKNKYMKEFLNSRSVKYVLWFLGLSIVKYLSGFETTVLWIGAYLLVDINYVNKNDSND